MYSCSPTLNQISLKNSFGKVIFQILAKIKMKQNKNRLFDRHFETVQHFQFFCRIVIFYSPYTYGANFIAKFGWENVFLLLGLYRTPLGHQRLKYLGRLSVNLKFLNVS